MKAWLQRRWERRIGHVTVGEWLIDLGMPTPLAVGLKVLHEKQHPDGWRSCPICVETWDTRIGGKVTP